MGERLPLLGSSKRKEHESQKHSGVFSPPTLSALVYGFVNVIIAAPGLYGYASVIFKDPVFHPYRNDLAKLVISSSLVHQLGFTMFSSLDFAIGTVQDAGLVFLSAMSSKIAENMRDDNAAAILSTTLVLLSLGTAVLGLVLIVLGKFQLANAVSFLPFGAVGGYLAFIGWFCVQAGTSLATSSPLDSFGDVLRLLENGHELILALPALMAGLLLAIVARNMTSGAALPLTMVGIPIVFYVILGLSGCSMDCAREYGWVGSTTDVDSVSVDDETPSLWKQLDISLVRWDLISELLWIWIGMVFVVSFASCLDVAAISMDMGEPLDTNKELATVGVCNLMSGLTGGYSGSYIFSQTIFTFRTGVHSRWIGGFVMLFFAAVIASPVDILQISPLFFFGSTLIFIGFDLLYEWFYEIRSTLSLAEYGTIWGTFLAIQILGIDFGMLVGVLVAILEHVAANAQTTAVHRVGKRSRAVWSPEEFNVLNNHAYNSISPKIMTLEISGPCFFGSSIALLQNMVGELGIDPDQPDIREGASVVRSPHASASALRRNNSPPLGQKQSNMFGIRRPPQFCVVDLTQVSNIDASAARGCFLTLSKMAAKRGISLFACGASPRIDWMLRSHGASYEIDEASKAMDRLRKKTRDVLRSSEHPTDKIIMFLTSYEALEFSESLLINEIHYRGTRMVSTNFGPKEQTLSSIFSRLIEATAHEEDLLTKFDQGRYHEEIYFAAGERIFTKDSKPEAFYVVLQGNIASGKARKDIVYRNRQEIVTGAGLLPKKRSGSLSDLLDPSLTLTDVPAAIATIYPVGGIFGYTDVLLGRPRSFEAFATKQSKIARIDTSHLKSLQHEDPVLNGLLYRALVKVGVLDLANCTCDDV